jgi:hypothetical protein
MAAGEEAAADGAILDGQRDQLDASALARIDPPLLV